MFLLDTDHLVLLQRRSEPEYGNLCRRMSAFQKTDFVLSMISFHEQFLGANAFIGRAKDRASVVRGYQMMEQTQIDFSRFRVLPFDEPAAIEFEIQRKQRIRIGTMDLRIASIAISHKLTLLTRNGVDFNQIPDLACEDWSGS